MCFVCFTHCLATFTPLRWCMGGLPGGGRGSKGGGGVWLLGWLHDVSWSWTLALGSAMMTVMATTESLGSAAPRPHAAGAEDGGGGLQSSLPPIRRRSKSSKAPFARPF